MARLKRWGLGSEPLFDVVLGTPAGQALLARLTAGAAPGSADATPLGAMVNQVKGCASAGDLRARLDELAR